MPKIQIPEKLEPFLTKRKRFKVAVGGRGAAKSQSIADMLLFQCQTEGIKIACFRELQNSINDSVHALLSDEIRRLDLEGYHVENASIYHKDGGEFRFKGLSRNPDAVKSMHGFKKFWIEEGQSVSAESLKMLTPTLREEDSEIWISMNLGSSEDPISKRFINPYLNQLLSDGYYEDDLHLIVVINHNDNPFFPAVLEQERLWDFENKPRNEYDNIWGFAFNDTVESAIILPEWFDACIDAHIKLGFKPKGQKILSHDPSDVGSDPSAYAIRYGSVVLDVDEYDKKDVNDNCDVAIDKAIEYGVDLFRWDADGLGATLRRQVSQAFTGKKIEYEQFKGSEEVDNPLEIYQGDNKDRDNKQARTNEDTFRNKRSQYYWMLRDRCYATYRAVVKKDYVNPDELISFSSNIKKMQKIKAELCRIPKKPSGNGFIQIMTKPEMRQKYQIESPNMSDCVMMLMPQQYEKKKWQPIEYKSKASIA